MFRMDRGFAGQPEVGRAAGTSNLAIESASRADEADRFRFHTRTSVEDGWRGSRDAHRQLGGHALPVLSDRSESLSGRSQEDAGRSRSTERDRSGAILHGESHATLDEGERIRVLNADGTGSHIRDRAA